MEVGYKDYFFFFGIPKRTLGTFLWSLLQLSVTIETNFTFFPKSQKLTHQCLITMVFAFDFEFTSNAPNQTTNSIKSTTWNVKPG